MKCRKILTGLCAAIVLLVNCSTMTAFAEESTSTSVATATDENVRAAGLIMAYSLRISSGTKKIYISATTDGYDTMAKIGFKDIVIQRSSNGTSGWTDAVSLGDQLATDSLYHYLDQYAVSVSGGYYYRVVLTHYAKEQGWFFPSSQSITNYSNVVWVSAS